MKVDVSNVIKFAENVAI